MKATKFLSLAALALTFAACSNEDDPLTAQQTADNMITITAKLASKDDVAQTRAVREDKNSIIVEWAVDEHLAILYTKDEKKYLADARITDVDGTTGEATIEFSVESGTPDSTACTIVYPISAAKDDHSGVKSYADLLAKQDGKLDGDLDIRVGAGTIQTSTPGLTVTKQPAAQYGIVKFTVEDLNGAAINVTEFKFSDNAGNVITTVTPDSATSVLYVTMPSKPRVSNGTLNNFWFNATAEGKPYLMMANIKNGIDAGKFYPTTVNMATVGDVIVTRHLFSGFAPASSPDEKLAMIAYIGNERMCHCSHGLAIELTNDPKYKTWKDANSYNYNRYYNYDIQSAFGGTWRLPSDMDWAYMFIGCAIDGDDHITGHSMDIEGFKEKIIATGIRWKENAHYWTSSRGYDRSRNIEGAYDVHIDLASNKSYPAFATFHVRKIEGERANYDTRIALGCFAF